MKKKIIIATSAIFISLVAYLWAAHHFIYKRIGDAGLKSPDTKYDYIIGSGADNGAILTYTALGDSLTSGVGVLNYGESYPYRLAKMISSSTYVTLHDRAYPGARTGDVIKDLLTTAINDKPDIVTLLIGVNDVHGFVSKTVFTENYAELIRRLKTETKAKIIAVSIPYIGADSLLLPPYNTYFKHQTIEYNKIIQKLAQKNNIKYVDLYSPTEHMFADATLYASDSFHPSAKGYALWAQIIYASIDK